MNLKKCNADDCHTKRVIKPSSESGYWKVVCEPKHRDFRILMKKIPIGSLLHFQFPVGPDFIRNSTGWKWKVTSAFGLPGSPKVRQKTKLPIFPGFDTNVDWNVQYKLLELHGYLSLSFTLCYYDIVLGYDLIGHKLPDTIRTYVSACISFPSFSIGCRTPYFQML